jgi:peptidoglycan hydrolase-like protein with peptidoglycan-binding domain
VRDVQRKLNDLGYHAGPADGLFGPKTRSALRAFQEEKDLHANGRIDVETLAALHVNATRPNGSPTAGTRGSQPEEPSARGAAPGGEASSR